MIVKEIIKINNTEFQKVYSDLGFYILNNKGIKFSSVINPQGYYDREYSETNELIPVYPERMGKNVSGE